MAIEAPSDQLISKFFVAKQALVEVKVQAILAEEHKAVVQRRMHDTAVACAFHDCIYGSPIRLQVRRQVIRAWGALGAPP